MPAFQCKKHAEEKYSWKNVGLSLCSQTATAHIAGWQLSLIDRVAIFSWAFVHRNRCSQNQEQGMMEAKLPKNKFFNWGGGRRSNKLAGRNQAKIQEKKLTRMHATSWPIYQTALRNVPKTDSLESLSSWQVDWWRAVRMDHDKVQKKKKKESIHRVRQASAPQHNKHGSVWTIQTKVPGKNFKSTQFICWCQLLLFTQSVAT